MDSRGELESGHRRRRRVRSHGTCCRDRVFDTRADHLRAGYRPATRAAVGSGWVGAGAATLGDVGGGARARALLGRAAVTATIHVGPLQPVHRTRLEEIVRATGVFSNEELGVAVELFDEALGSRLSAVGENEP